MRQDLRTARWDIFPKCNLNCIHCSSEGLFDKNDPKYLDKEHAIGLLDILWQEEITNLNILGKEPFLHPYIFDILQHACKLGFQVDITTNGTMINDKDIPLLVSLGLRSIFISIDGSCPQVNDVIRGKGVFKKAFHTMQKLVKEKRTQESPLMINVNTVLTQINKFDITGIADLCSINDVNLFKLSHMMDMGNASKNLNKLILGPNEEFEIAEQITKIVPNYSNLEFDILSDKPLFIEYLYEKYKFITPVRLSGCKACLREIYIDPIGDISPCLGTSSGFFNLSNGYYQNYKFNIFELDGESICNLKFYEDFKSIFPLREETYKNYEPCNHCSYLTTICYPCPLNSLKKVHHENFCLIAQKKLMK